MNVAKQLPTFDKSDIQRFWAKVNKTEQGCWLWTASTTKHGYGRFQIAGSAYQAHRLAYFLTTQEDPGTLLVCHNCDIPGCCKPDHLFLGTNQENMDDKRQKGRLPIGSKHWEAKLTEDDVRHIRSAPETSLKMATAYGVSPALIQHIRRHMIWKHVA